MKKTLSLFALIGALFVSPLTSAPTAAADDMSGWRKAVVKSVAKNQRYPRAAQAREIEGKAKIRLVVAKDGSITAHEIVEATGEKVLDRQIPKLVAKLNPLPALPEGRESLQFVLPIEWALD